MIYRVMLFSRKDACWAMLQPALSCLGGALGISNKRIPAIHAATNRLQRYRPLPVLEAGREDCVAKAEVITIQLF